MGKSFSLLELGCISRPCLLPFQVYFRAWFLEVGSVEPGALASLGGSLEMGSLGPTLDPLNQNPHFNQSPGWWVHMHSTI